MLTTGGSIAMAFDADHGGAVAQLDGSQLLAAAGRVGDVELELLEWGALPSTHLSFADLCGIAAELKRALARDDIDGAVVVQGTDTMEETSFALDLMLESEKPAVVVGATRTADEPDYDGPRNLRDAIRCAASPALAGQGVVVCMDSLIHGADDVVKVHANSQSAMASPNFGPLGIVDADGVTVMRARRGRRTIPGAAPAPGPVPLLTAVLEMDGTLVRGAREQGALGLVIAGAGAGNVPPRVLDEARLLIDEGRPVVLASRCLAGRPTTTYAYDGGGQSWERAGAVLAGYLSPVKARVTLVLALGAGLVTTELRRLFALHTAPPTDPERSAGESLHLG